MHNLALNIIKYRTHPVQAAKTKAKTITKTKNIKLFCLFLHALNALPIKFYRLVRIYSFVCFHYILAHFIRYYFYDHYAIYAVSEFAINTAQRTVY